MSAGRIIAMRCPASRQRVVRDMVGLAALKKTPPPVGGGVNRNGPHVSGPRSSLIRATTLSSPRTWGVGRGRAAAEAGATAAQKRWRTPTMAPNWFSPLATCAEVFTSVVAAGFSEGLRPVRLRPEPSRFFA